MLRHVVGRAAVPLSSPCLYTSPSIRMSHTESAVKGRSAEYGHARTGGFTQTAPVLHNPFRDDPILEKALRRILPKQDYERVAADLDCFGTRIVNEIDSLGRQAELEPPRLEQHDAWGARADRLVVSPAWNRLKEICAEEGIISIGYDPKVDAVTRRVHQIAKLFLFSPSAGLVTCPMAMTDGACKTLQSMGLVGKDPLCTETYERLVSRDPKRAWTSGQWMTEKKGGSDVGGGCDTYAVHQDGRKYKLHGYKWFSSAIDADISLTLARVEDGHGNAIGGSRGLSLFLVRLRDEQGRLNGIQMVRLKNKLGTRQLPTAELLLDGTRAEKLGEDGRGVPAIANMLNITRVHNAAASCAGMRRILALARDYSTRREVFGQKQADWPLHLSTLAELEVTTRTSVLLLLESARLLGLQESGRASHTDLLMLRLITPVVKLYTGKLCVPLISEGIECFGGQGYIEDTGLPTILRDAQVTPIWEGTTNVLALDVLRVFAGKDNVLAALVQHVNDTLPKQVPRELEQAKATVQKAMKEVAEVLAKVSDAALRHSLRLDMGARHVAISLGKILSGALAIQHAAGETGTQSDIEVANRFCMEGKLVDVELKDFAVDRATRDRQIVFENFAEKAAKSKI